MNTAKACNKVLLTYLAFLNLQLLARGALLDTIFEQQDYLWNTDQGKSFKAFWEFLMSENMQQELEMLIEKLNDYKQAKSIMMVLRKRIRYAYKYIIENKSS